MTEKPTPRVDGEELDVLDYENNVSKRYVPEGFDSVEEFLTDMRETYEADLDFDQFNREAALEDKKFSAGEQWDPIALESRKGLPCLILNSIPQYTAQLVGDWRESRRAIKVLPSNNEDVDIAEIRGELIRGIEYHSRADRIYDSAFESLVQCGDGSFRVAVEYARDDVFDQDIFIRPIEDCLSVVWDRYSVDPTGRDARHVFVEDRIPCKEYEKKWPGITISELRSNTNFYGNLNGAGWIDDQSVKVTEYWRIIEREKEIGLFPNGKIFIIEPEDRLRLIYENGEPVKTRIAWCRYAQMHLVTGFAILAGPFEYKLNRVPIIRMSGRIVNVGDRRIRYGLVRFIKDSIRDRNFVRSVALEQLGYAPKAKWLAQESAVEGREDQFRKAHLSRNQLLTYNDGAEPPQLIPPPPIEASLLQMAQINTQDLKELTGLYDASLGAKSNETSGRAIMARQREGDIASLTFYDNANAAVLEAGDVANQLLPQVYDSTRVLRGIGEDEQLKFYEINDPFNPNAIDLSVGEFDVALSTGVSYSTRRQEAAQALMDLVQVYPQFAQVAGDIIAKYMDFPGADKLAERIKKTIPPQYLEEDEGGGLGVTPEQLQELQMTLQTLAQENQQLKTDKTIDLKKLEIDEYNAETQRIRALGDHWVDQEQLNHSAIANILQKSKELDDQEIKKAELDYKGNLERDKMSMDAEKAKQASQAPSKPRA